MVEFESVWCRMYGCLVIMLLCLLVICIIVGFLICLIVMVVSLVLSLE